MKKKHLTYGKKTLSVFLAALMLMTCWVFVAPEKAEAADSVSATENYNKSMLSEIDTNVNYTVDTTGNYYKFKIYGTGDDGGDNTTARQQKYYKNVLSHDGGTSLVGDTNRGSYFTNVTNSELTVSIVYPTMVLKYDGITTPKFGIMLEADSSSGKKIRFERAWMDANSNGLSFNPNYWLGIAKDDSAFFYIMEGSATKYLYAQDTSNGNVFSARSNGQWEFLAASLEFTGSMSIGEWVRTISPTWKFSNGSTTYTGTNTSTIYVMNFKGYGDLLTQINNKKNDLLNNAAKYTPESIRTFVDAAKAITNLNPKNYTAIGSVTSWGSQMATAYSNYTTAVDGLKFRKVDIQAENLFSFADWANSKSKSYEVNIDKGTVKIAADSSKGEVVTTHSGSSTRDTSMYAIEVEANTEYTLEWTTSTTQNADKVGSEMFAFFYDVNNNAFSTWANYSGHGSSNGTNDYTFTTPANTKYMEVRFDLNNSGYASNMTFSDVKLYKTSRAEEIGFADWTAGRSNRKVCDYGATPAAFDTPARPGYKFDGWTNADGSAYTASPITSSKTVYSKWSKKTLDIGYDNLFSFSDWYYSKSNGVNDSTRGTMNADVDAGTITFNATVNDFFTPNNGAAGYYTATVEPNTTYVLDFDLALKSGGMQIGVWYYTDSLTSSAVKGYDISYSETDGYYEFTTPSDCTKAAIRFGVTAANGEGTYSDIGIYKTSAYNSYAKDYSKVREPFKVEDTTKLMIPTRAGYVFDGWEKANGTKIENVTGLTASETVYATWTKQWTVTFYNGDGTVLGTSIVKDGGAAKDPEVTPTKASDAEGSYSFSGWDTDFSKVTGDMTVNPVFTKKVHTATYYFVSDRTCEKNAKVDKICSTCGYVFFLNGEYDGTEVSNWIKLGHSYDTSRIITGTSTGPDGTHKIECERYLICGSTKAVAHSFDKTESTEGANCITAGTVTKSCACGQKTVVAGEIDPNTHNHTRLINVVTPTCTENGYTGDTYCDDCKKTVKAGAVDPKLNHSFTNYVYNNDATCFADGTKTAKCDRCEETDEKPAEDTQLTHEYKDYNYNNDATCDKNGTKTAVCSHGCGTKSTIEAEGTKRTHIFEGTIKNNKDGTHSYECTYEDCAVYGGTVKCSSWKENETEGKCECTVCGYTKTHNWGEWQKNADNTGTEAGKMTRTCSDCSAVDEIDCTYEETAHFNKTCTTPERTEYTCTECGHGYTVIGEAATGHSFTTGTYKYNANTDSHQQLCANGCGTYGVGTTANAMEPCSWTYANKEEGKHTASCVCGNTEEQNCSGGTATCTAPANCEFCGKPHGDKAVHSFKGAVKVLDGDVHAYLCEFCGEDTGIYGIENEVNRTEDCSGGDATCSALAVCKECNDTYGELDADDHKWITTPVADADNAGKHIYTCEYDNKHKKSEDCESGSSVVVAPKCEEQGYTIQTCKKCSYEWNTDYTDATDHKWENPVCNNDGTHTLECVNENADGWVCNETLTLDCAESAITFGLEPATCTEQGYTTYQCTVCNYTWDDDFVPATGHSYTKKLRSLDAAYKRSEKTCTEAETYWYRCDNCNVSAGTEEDKYAENLASIYWTNGIAAGHKMEKLVDETDLSKNRKSEATCTASAVYYYSCSVCGEQDTTQTFTYKSALGHDYQDIVDADDLTKNRVSEATCTSAAIYNKSCSRCGDVSEETFEYGNKIGHSMTKTEAKEATCEEAGNVEYYTCSNCNKNFSDEEGTTTISKTEIDMLGHDWIDIPFKAASCEEDGHSAYKDCSRCDAVSGKKTEGYEATGHNFSGAYVYDAVIGYHSKKCVNKNCLADGTKAHGIGDVKFEVTYNEDDEIVVVGAEKCEFNSSETDTDENGIHSHRLVCVCGNETSKAYEDSATYFETVDPTCTADGYDIHKCPDCPDTWKKNIVKAEGHKLADAATQNADGKTHSVKCANCDYTSAAEYCSGGTATCKDKAKCSVCGSEYGSTTDHTLAEDGWTSNNDATCTEDGTKSQKCSVCETVVTETDKGSELGHSLIAEYVYDISGWENVPEDFDKVIKAPTCKEEGLGIIYCTRCDYYKTKTVKADSTAHVWQKDEKGELVWTLLSGDCSSGVTYKNICTVCEEKQTKVEEGSHTWYTAYEFKPTCGKPGIIKKVCSICKDEETITFDEKTQTPEELKPLDHAFGDAVRVEASCTEAAHTERVCSECGFVEKTAFDNENGPQHTFDKGISFKGNCETDAYTEYTCKECNYVEKVVTEKAQGHKDANDDGKCDECRGVMYDDSDSDKGCGCICHKTNWLMKFVYKILRFFWKLFRISRTCECGAVHW